MAPSPAELRSLLEEARPLTRQESLVIDADEDVASEQTRPRRLKVWRVMRPVPEGIAPETSVVDAEEKMDRDGVNWLPVVDQGRCVGLLTRQDIRSALRRRPRRGRSTILSVTPP